MSNDNAIACALKRLHQAFCGAIHIGRRLTGGEYDLPLSAFDTHGHIVGPTGGGKTRLLQAIAEGIVDAGEASLLILEPHDGPPPFGGLYHAVKSYCYERGHQDRMILIDPEHPFTHGAVAGFNPLSHGRSPSLQAAFFVEDIRAVCGDNGTFAAAPQLAQWAFNTGLGLIIPELALHDAIHVLSLTDNSYRRILVEILQERYPDVASDWQHVVKNPQFLDDKVGSTSRRIKGYVQSDAMRHMLDTRTRTVDFSQLTREPTVVLANMATRDILDVPHQQMCGKEIVRSVIHAAKNRKPGCNVGISAIVDEFQLFQCPEMLEVLDGTRKFGLRLILAHQFMSQLQDAALQDWRMYHSVMVNARCKIVFGGLPETDADTLAQHIYGSRRDPYKVKDEIHHTIQLSRQRWVELVTKTRAMGGSIVHQRATVDGYGLARGGQRSRTRGTVNTAAGANSSAMIDTSGYTFPESGLPTFSQAYGMVLGDNASGATSEIDLASDGENWLENVLRATARGVALGHSWQESEARQLVPIVEPLAPERELSSREFMALEEQLYEHVARLRNLPDRHVVVLAPNEEPAEVYVRDVPDPYYTQAEVAPEDHQLLHSAPWAAPLPVIEEESRARNADFLKLLPRTTSTTNTQTKSKHPEPERLPHQTSRARTRASGKKGASS